MNELTRQDLIEKIVELIVDYDAKQLDSIDIEGVNGEQLDCILESLQFAQIKAKNKEGKVLEEEGIAPYCPNCGSGEYQYFTHLVDMYQCAKCGGLISGSDIKTENELPYTVEGYIIPPEKTLIPSQCPHCGRKIEFVTWRFRGEQS